MKLMQYMSRTDSGFALPTIIIASVILLTILVTSVTAVGSITSALANQYYNQLAREAAESGLARARACLRNSGYSPTWTDAAPLRPNTDCNGTVSGLLSQWIVNNNNVRTTFTVGAPSSGAAASLRVSAVGRVELVRASNTSQVWRSYSYTGAESSRFNDLPQIASGAGWKTSGHNGYMLASNGTLYGWGDNAGGQLGTGLGTTVSTPVTIGFPDGVQKAKKVFNSGQGASILCILATHSTQGDQVYCRGIPGGGEIGLMPQTAGWHRFGLPGALTALDVALNGYGPDSACVLASDMQAYCAGENYFGTLGYGNNNGVIVPISSPVQFALTSVNPALTVAKVFIQDWQTCVIASDSRAYCAGANSVGQLGRGNTIANGSGIAASPAKVQIPGDLAVSDIRMTYHGPTNALFYKTTGNRMFMSGNNTQGTALDGLFNGTVYSTPREITSGTFSKLISVGEEGGAKHSVCVLGDALDEPNSAVWCAGSNKFGQLGNGNCGTSQATWQGIASLGGETVTKSPTATMNYQMNSVMVITTDGNVWAWGDNTYGKLGRGGAPGACNSTPARVLLPAGVKAVDLANGDEYSAFILGDNGKVYAMGRNNNGQLGDGTTIDRTTPVEVKLPRQAILY